MQDIWIPAVVLVANLSAVVVGIVRLTYEINTLQVGFGHKSASSCWWRVALLIRVTPHLG